MVLPLMFGLAGLILFLLLMGWLPFDDRNLAVLYQKVLTKQTTKLQLVLNILFDHIIPFIVYSGSDSVLQICNSEFNCPNLLFEGARRTNGDGGGGGGVVVHGGYFTYGCSW